MGILPSNEQALHCRCLARCLENQDSGCFHLGTNLIHEGFAKPQALCRVAPEIHDARMVVGCNHDDGGAGNPLVFLRVQPTLGYTTH